MFPFNVSSSVVSLPCPALVYKVSFSFAVVAVSYLFTFRWVFIFWCAILYGARWRCEVDAFRFVIMFPDFPIEGVTGKLV